MILSLLEWIDLKNTHVIKMQGPNSKFHGESHLCTWNLKVVFGTGKGYSYQAYWFPKTKNEFIPEAVSSKDLSLSRHQLSVAFAKLATWDPTTQS